MKNIIFILILSTISAHGAALSKSGPLQVGNFDPYVSQTATNKINDYYLPEATKRNNNVLPSGSVAALWQAIGGQGASQYFETHKDQLEASAPYIERSNDNELTTALYKRASECTCPLDIRLLQWELYSLAVVASFGMLKKETIPELDLKPMTVVGIIEANQSLTFTPEENASFGGEIAASLSVMNLIFKSDEPAFKRLYQPFLPKIAKDQN